MDLGRTRYLHLKIFVPESFDYLVIEGHFIKCGVSS